MALQQICRNCIRYTLGRRFITGGSPAFCSSSASQIPPRPPDYDLDGAGMFNEGERLFESPKPGLTDVEESREEWKFVERILPMKTVPDPPKHDKYPTPSGWVPQTASPEDNAYFIRRTRYHNFPIYHELFDGGSRKMTVIRLVEGDLWALDAEVRQYLEKQIGQRMHTQVDEIAGKIRVRGSYLEEISQFLIDKGM